jgi:hypothetical protein
MAASETVQRLEQQAAEAGRLQVVNQLLLDESARQRLQELRKRLGEALFDAGLVMGAREDTFLDAPAGDAAAAAGGGGGGANGGGADDLTESWSFLKAAAASFDAQAEALLNGAGAQLEAARAFFADVHRHAKKVKAARLAAEQEVLARPVTKPVCVCVCACVHSTCEYLTTAFFFGVGGIFVGVLPCAGWLILRSVWLVASPSRLLFARHLPLRLTHRLDLLLPRWWLHFVRFTAAVLHSFTLIQSPMLSLIHSSFPSFLSGCTHGGTGGRRRGRERVQRHLHHHPPAGGAGRAPQRGGGLPVRCAHTVLQDGLPVSEE